jgi:hypothetical protein
MHKAEIIRDKVSAIKKLCELFPDNSNYKEKYEQLLLKQAGF